MAIVKSKQGPYIAIYNNEQAEIESINGEYPWSAVCMEHEYTLLCETLRIAREATADPLEWCGRCWMAARENSRAMKMAFHGIPPL